MDKGSRTNARTYWARAVEYFRPGKFAKNIGILAGGMAAAQVIRLAAEPVLTRLFSQSDYGIYNLYLAVMSFAAVGVCLRYELAVFLPEDDEDAAAAVVMAAVSSLLVGIAAAAAAFLLVGYGVLRGDFAALNDFVWIFPLSVVGYGMFQTLSFWMSRRKRFKSVIGGKFSHTGGQAVTQVSFGLVSATPFGLIVGDAAGRVLGSLYLAAGVLRHDAASFRALTRAKVWEVAKRYREFPIVATPSALINIAALSVPMLMIGAYFGAATLGMFGLAYRVMSLPAGLTTQAVSQVYMSEAGRLASVNPKSMRTLYTRTLRKLLVIGFVPHFAVVLFGPWLFGFVFGDGWQEAGVYARLLVATHYLNFAIGPLLTTLNMLERQRLQFAWDVGRAALSIGCVFVAWRLGLGTRWTVFLLGSALTAGLVSHVALVYWAVGSRIRDFSEAK
ncbi:MAG: lipopolysaccharide biosynthesis protein [Armatimonadetes bacterium]|nr:lipopolysaccharide biosynthesis protein [Armatimonadota bacterium]